MPEPKSPMNGFRPLSNPPTPNQPSPLPVPQNSPPVTSRTFTPPEQNPSSQPGNNCHACGSLNQSGSLHCVNCGTPLAPQTPISNTQSGVCPQCATPFQPGSQFCIRCGYQLSNPSQRPSRFQPIAHAAAPIHGQPTTFNTSSIISSPLLWPIIALAGAGLAIVCFFLPFIVIKVNNPAALLYGGPEQINLSMSAWQLMTMSSPTITGLGGLGEAASNMYDQMDMGRLIAEYADATTKALFLLSRMIMFVLGAIALVAVIFAYRSFSQKQEIHKVVKIGLGAIGVVLLLATSLVVNVGFNTGSADLDILLNSVVKFSNGFGFWGMFLGFSAFSFASYKKS